MATTPSSSSNCIREHGEGACKPAAHKTLLSLRTLALLTTSIVVGVLAVIGTLSATDANMWAAGLAGVAAAAVALERLNRWTEA